MKEELFIWFYSNPNTLPKGVPATVMTTITEEFYPKNPTKIKRGEWIKYSPMYFSFPPEEKYKLPEELILVVKRQKEVLFDFLGYYEGIRVFSDRLLNLLIENGLNSQYEKATLNIVNTKGVNIAKQPYYLLRFCRADNELFAFNDNLKIVARDWEDTFLYPDLHLKEPTDRNVFVLGNVLPDDYFCYQNALVIKKSLKKEIEKLCYAPEIYSVSEFPEVYNTCLKW